MSRASLTSTLKAPLHLAALATGASSFRDNPILGSPNLNPFLESNKEDNEDSSDDKNNDNNNNNDP